jgi:hypothetical protein
MKIQEIREIAKKWDVNARIGRTKEAIIRDIQLREGYLSCFGSKSSCDEKECIWRADCLK